MLRLFVRCRPRGWALAAIFTTTLDFHGLALGQTPASAPVDDVAGVASTERIVGGDAQKRYLLIQADPAVQPPAEGFGLVLVIPGGDGSESNLGFVKRVFKASLSDRYVVAQLVPARWSPDQKLVWPTEQLTAPGQQFSTEAFAAAVIRDVCERLRVDRQRIFTFAWSTGGPAAYALSVMQDTPVRGSLIAMSVFTPSLLPGIDRARGQAYFLYHSPDDKVCRFEFAATANEVLSNLGATVELRTYDGGHGWQGSHFVRLSAGFRWLEDHAGATQPAASSRPAMAGPVRMPAESAAPESDPGRGYADAAPPPDAPRSARPPAASGAAPGAAAPPIERSARPPAATQPAGAVNLLPNGGFEAGTSGWLVMNNSGRSSVQLDRDGPREGAQALRVSRTGGGPADAVRRSLDVPAAGRYVVSAYVKCKDAAGAVLKFFAYDDGGNPLIFDVDVGTLPASSEWCQVAKTYSLTAGVRTASIMLVIPSDGTVWLDDVRVSPDNSGP